MSNFDVVNKIKNGRTVAENVADILKMIEDGTIGVSNEIINSIVKLIADVGNVDNLFTVANNCVDAINEILLSGGQGVDLQNIPRLNQVNVYTNHNIFNSSVSVRTAVNEDEPINKRQLENRLESMELINPYMRNLLLPIDNDRRFFDSLEELDLMHPSPNFGDYAGIGKGTNLDGIYLVAFYFRNFDNDGWFAQYGGSQSLNSNFVDRTHDTNITGKFSFQQPIIQDVAPTQINELVRQQELNDYVPINGNVTITGIKTFSESPAIPHSTLGTRAVRRDQVVLLTENQNISGTKTFGSNANFTGGVNISGSANLNNQRILTALDLP